MPEIFHSLASIAAPLGFAAVALFIALIAFSRKLKNRVKIIESVPEKDRVKLVDEWLTRYKINGSDLTKKQRYDLIKEEMQRRFDDKRSLRTLLAVVCVIVIALAMAMYVIEIFFPPDKRVVLVTMDKRTLQLIRATSEEKSPFQIKLTGGEWVEFPRSGLIIGANTATDDLLTLREAKIGIKKNRLPQPLDLRLPSGQLEASLRQYNPDNEAYEECNGQAAAPQENDLWVIKAHSICNS